MLTFNNKNRTDSQTIFENIFQASFPTIIITSYFIYTANFSPLLLLILHILEKCFIDSRHEAKDEYLPVSCPVCSLSVYNHRGISMPVDRNFIYVYI